MLDNLVNADLSGVKGYISYSYDSMSQVVPSLITSMAVLIFLIIVAMSVHRLFVGSKSSQYKHFLTDMWVVGKVKQLAAKDNVDLEAEIKEFVISDKKSKIYQKSIAEVIEQEMKEEIANQKKKIIESKD